MRLLLLLLCLLFSGCTTTASRTTFPEPPAKLMSDPRELELLSPKVSKLIDQNASDNSVPSGVPLSEAAVTISHNYTTYKVTAETLKLLQEWIREQQKVYNK